MVVVVIWKLKRCVKLGGSEVNETLARQKQLGEMIVRDFVFLSFIDSMESSICLHGEVRALLYLV